MPLRHDTPAGLQQWAGAGRRGLEALRRLFFPPRPTCPACHRLGVRSPAALCRPCYERIPPVTGCICDRCGRPLRGGGESICLACRGATRYFTVARAPAVYADAMRDYMRRFKYGGERELGLALATLLTAHVVRLPELWPVDVVVPMPLHRERLEQRGFNQAELLGRALAEGIGRRLSTDALYRRRSTTTQSRLSAEARRDNVHGAFVVRRPTSIAGLRMLLVDDVLTSGATADEASRVLLQAGAMNVKVACVAVGIYDRDWAERHVVG